MAQTRTMTDSGSDPTDPRKPDPDSGNDPSSGQPTGWERPSPDSGSTAAGPSSASSAPDWPTYPPSGAESTRPLPPDQSYQQPYQQPYQPPYQPYDPQSMPGYGSSSGYPSADTPQSYPETPAPGAYGSNPYETTPYQGAYPGYAAYGPAPNHPQAVTAFVLGLVGLVVCTPVGIGGLVIGGRVRKEIDAAPGQYSGRGLATAGWVLGIISVVLLALAVVFVIIGVAAGAFSN